jgi:hypothetical protein
VGAGLVVGALLVAAVLLPFAARLGDNDLDYRAQGPDDNLGIPTLLTSVAPTAFGLSSQGRPYRGPVNPVEAIAFVGVTTAVLALLAVALPRSRRTPAGVVPVLTGATLVIGVATFAGGPPLSLLQNLPVFTNSFVGRTRSVLGFTVAVLAALAEPSTFAPVTSSRTDEPTSATVSS